MNITYIHHSGFLAELEHSLLLFDYAGGQLPEMDLNKELIVFASHRHGDHFDPAIFELAGQHPQIRFVLSGDIWKKRVPEHLFDKTYFMKAHENLALPCSDDRAAAIHITAYRSTDEGVAFVVTAEGKTIYHAGDLNDWRWEGEAESWNKTMHANYMQELEKIRADGVKPDAAMVPVDGRLEQWFYLGLQEFMETVGADMVFPMHFWKDFGIISRLKQLPCTAGYRDKIADIARDGQTFVL